METLSGQLLVAAPELLDPNFARTIVLMVEHTDQGALGLVVNRPSEKSLAELWREVAEGECENDRPIHIGGPVPGPLMALHGAADLAELTVCNGVYFSAKNDNLDRLVRRADVPLKVFVGHSGWGPGQLENEMEMGGWIVAGGSASIVFSDSDATWDQLIADCGGGRRSGRVAKMLDIRNIPPDPTVN